MMVVGRRWGALVLVGAMGTCGSIACSSVELPVSDGVGGSVAPAVVVSDAGGAGMGGQGAGGSGAGGTLALDAGADPDGGQCAALEDAYLAGIEIAKRCDPAATVPQCTQAVISSLSCPCSIFVNDTTAPYAARMAWDAASCPAHSVAACQASCPARLPAACVPVGDGTGRCTPIAL